MELAVKCVVLCLKILLLLVLLTFIMVLDYITKWNDKHNIYVLNIPTKDSIEEYIYNFCKSRNNK